MACVTETVGSMLVGRCRDAVAVLGARKLSASADIRWVGLWRDLHRKTEADWSAGALSPQVSKCAPRRCGDDLETGRHARQADAG